MASNSHNEQLKILLNNKQDLKAEAKRLKKIEKARQLVINLDYGTAWFKYQTVKKLYMYLEIDFVRDKLISLYKATDNQDLKDLIRSLHDGDFDAEDIISEYESRLEYEQEAEEAAEFAEMNDYEDESESSGDANLDFRFLRSSNKAI